MNTIDRFTGEYEFLSNFYWCDVVYEGVIYPSTEHAYQAAKTLDEDMRKRIAKISSPGLAKKEGRKVRLRDDWNQVKLDIMYKVCLEKFTKHQSLKEALLATGDKTLVEGNNWGDKYWGMVNGVGQNHLGKILMRIRSEMK